VSVTVATVDDVEELRAELRAAIERIAVLERERVHGESKPAAEWMAPAKYAARRGLSSRTVAKLIAEGLPSTRIGRARRVDVVAADAWLASHGGTT
jgi:hypothetical protein